MANLIKVQVFERTSFSQLGSLFTAALGLIAAPQFTVATRQLTESYRTYSKLPLDTFERTDFPQTAPLRTIPENLYRDLFTVNEWAAIQHEVNTFRSEQRERLDFRYYTQPEFSWLDELLTRWDVASTKLLTNSFRSKEASSEDAQRLDPRKTDFPQSTPLRTIPLDLYRDQFQTAFWPTIAHQLSVFRSDQGELLQYSQHLTRPLFPPILRNPVKLPNFQVPIFVVEGIIG